VNFAVDVSVEFSVYKNPYTNPGRLGLRPDPTGGELTALSRSLASLKGPLTTRLECRRTGGENKQRERGVGEGRKGGEENGGPGRGGYSGVFRNL